MRPLFTENEFNIARATDKLPCSCYVCNKTYYKIKYKIKQLLKKNQSTKYCSNKCYLLGVKAEKKETNCVYCNKKTLNPKFCSKSCSASFSNKNKPKRKLTRICCVENCVSLVKSSRYRHCETHYKENVLNKIKNKTIGEYRNKESVKGKHQSWLHSLVRGLCRSWLKHLTKIPCANCGYEKHVELCHIKSVASFGDETILSVVNSEDNVIQLCRNCHWELDHGILDINTING
jgi:hypothetical protein